jgi:hypothetical protein
MFAFACGGPPASPTPPMTADPGPPEVEIHLDHALATEIIATMEQLGNEPVYVRGDALVALACASIDVESPKIPRHDAVEKLGAGVRKRGFVVEHRDGAWHVRMPAENPPSCPRPPAEPAKPEEVMADIREITPTEHVITKRARDSILKHADEIARECRIVPEQENGVVVGMRLFGIRAGSLLQRLGFENGDRLERVMGRSVNSPEAALKTYSELPSMSRIEIDIIRHGTPATLVVRVE